MKTFVVVKLDDDFFLLFLCFFFYTKWDTLSFGLVENRHNFDLKELTPHNKPATVARGKLFIIRPLESKQIQLHCSAGTERVKC